MKKEDGKGGSLELGLSSRQQFDGKTQGRAADEKTGIPAQVKAEKHGKHTIK